MFEANVDSLAIMDLWGNGLFHMMKVELEGGVDQTKKGVVVFVRC